MFAPRQPLKWREDMLHVMHTLAVIGRLRVEGYAGHHDWQVPQIPDIASTIERQCFNRRINEQVFSSTPPLAFWSATERMGYDEYAYTVSFGQAGAVRSPKNYEGAVRLMRGGPWWSPPQNAMSDT